MAISIAKYLPIIGAPAWVVEKVLSASLWQSLTPSAPSRLEGEAGPQTRLGELLEKQHTETEGKTTGFGRLLKEDSDASVEGSASLKKESKATGAKRFSSPTRNAATKESEGVHFGGESKTQGGYRGVAVDVAPQDKNNVPTVHSIRGGTVVGVGDEAYDTSGYGNYVKILQDDGKVVLYAHLAQRPTLEKGQTVKAGERLGLMGSSGRSTGTHLHLEFRQPDSTDPDKYTTDTTGLVEDYRSGNFTPMDYLEGNAVSI